MNSVTLARKLWPYIRIHRGRLALALVLTSAGALLAQVTPLVMEYSVNTVQEMVRRPVPPRQVMISVGTLVAVLLGKDVLSLLLVLWQKYLSDGIRFRMAGDLYHETIRRLLSYELDFFALPQNHVGKLEKRIDKGIESITKTVKNMLVDILPMLASAGMALIIIYRKNVWVGVAATVVVPLYFWISREQTRRQRDIRLSIQSVREEKASALFGLLDSIFVVKSFVRERYETGRQHTLNSSLVASEIRHHRTNYLFDGLKGIAEQIGVMLVFSLTVFFVLRQEMTVGAILLHLMLFNNVSAPVRHLHRIYDEYSEALSYSEGFFAMLDSEAYLPRTGGLTAEALAGDLVMDEVNFVYPNGTQALTEVSLRIERGKTTALVGLSGAGKSSAMNVLAGFYRPSAGQVLLDGVDIASYDPDWLRQNVGIVMQRNHIFGGSVAENIRYGRLDASDAEVMLAAQQASLHDQVARMPRGYDTPATELSGGQQQRIAIARLFLKNPPIIFLDEPTASLDAIAAEQIRDSLEAVKRSRTVLLISHSISQIMDADVIYVMKDGRVVARGTHESLYDDGGLYREIIDSNARTLNISRLAATLEPRSSPRVPAPVA